MRFMVIVKSTPETEQGVMPTSDELAAMGNYNEELVKAGVMLAGDGLYSSDKGARVRFDGKGATTVIDGPFTESKELIAGFWIWELPSLQDAVEWLKKAPFQEGEVEIRQVHGDEAFGDALTPEIKAQEDRMREQIASRSQ
ncbi:YciI family protein [Lentzea sp. BCCO 10_0061]|uniref:YciI family protein n=1 Tax=Lentzea sokolovensis TaxID=3095429 RepID=A0ABU4UQ04_9PSEU|nr:YciI family protein [Lentzea sp. BCCO 10_0061]MDX8141109.1 YciI family protein [Lentzea sp. BCCO 10_0061]